MILTMILPMTLIKTLTKTLTMLTPGNRGVVTLPQDWVYHDNNTLAASREAARYGSSFK